MPVLQTEDHAVISRYRVTRTDERPYRARFVVPQIDKVGKVSISSATARDRLPHETKRTLLSLGRTLHDEKQCLTMTDHHDGATGTTKAASSRQVSSIIRHHEVRETYATFASRTLMRC